MLQDKTGSRIPQITFHTRQNNEWVDVTTDDIFKGRSVVVFSLPGAFTPTCSSAHVPRFNELAPVFRDNGIDEIVCVSVNDTFVMNEWAKDQQADNIRFIPDGNGEFTAAMGMLVDKDDLGFGKRSWRYSMLVRDGVIEKMFIEPEVPGDPYEVSDADTMLNHINPQAQKPHDVVLFTKPGCPYCARAKDMLSDAGMEYEEINVGGQVSLRSVRAASGSDTVPQVWIDGVHIGDSEALAEWMQQREAA
ncbi:glutathione peroxidase [Thiohalobacter thiocyanaticus]|uniref:Glutathione peroxidase n=1 Tax=Thiohalobacter thiocyanaticus TaxID=585455 RepID=A0A426QIY1_9GAMM|nr:glutathione peroxidase [Thiohalobacter thiocyanaticus]RRQ21708.1 glutathione peroxidase [Thiohalobacter thiocyanaticus]